GQATVLVAPQSVPEDAEQRPGGVYPWTLQEFQHLLASLQSEEPPLRGVVHLWGLEAGSPQATTAASLHADQALLCGSALHLAQALATTVGTHGEIPRLWLVTSGAQAVATAEGRQTAPAPAQASLWGLGRVVALEHPDLWGGLVDLDPDATVGDAAAMLAAEVLQPSHEDNLAYREGRRFAARLVRSAERVPDLPAPRLSGDATYLVTGGLGGLGLQVARGLAAQGARHLVLAGRHDPSPAAREILDELSQAGVRVVAARADVAQEGEVARLLEEMRVTLPPLHGIVHAAGVVDDGVLLRQDWARIARVLAPKVEGAWNLHTLTAGLPLDFFVLFSSAVSLLGSAGQAGYAAANAFLDSLAHYRKAVGLPALSINWGPWAEVGMAAARGADRWAQLGMGSIEPRRGVRALARVLGAADAEIGVFPADWHAFGRHAPDGAGPPLLSMLMRELGAGGAVGAAAASGSSLLPRLRGAMPAVRSDLLLEHLHGEVAGVLGLDAAQPLDPDQGLFELGMDSLMAVELRNRLQLQLGMPLAGTLLFDYPTLTTLAAYLLDQLPADSTAAHEDTATAGESEDGRATLLAEIEELSDQDLDAMLASLSDSLLEGHSA
ncbi:MAG TPA: beta-ketoacyl reductase, partial [Chloroflexota bacterium]|nr:beta-ketoacyl reductase [Chloroflexota bacterium]